MTPSISRDIYRNGTRKTLKTSPTPRSRGEMSRNRTLKTPGNLPPSG
jgi:hypothetical protein